MTKDDSGCAVVIMTITVLGLVVGWVAIDHKGKEDVKRQKKIVANYQSPVEHTDTQRLDWLTAHPSETPWRKYGTDPRKEIDFALDSELEAKP